VIQRVVMRVDETGTEAAAATAIPTDRSYRQPPSFVADAPFLAVVLSKSGMPVVAALVTDPSRSTA
jgi:serine protease inhibitor